MVSPRKVLITGATGHLGSSAYLVLAGKPENVQYRPAGGGTNGSDAQETTQGSRSHSPLGDSLVWSPVGRRHGHPLDRGGIPTGMR